MLLTSRQQSIQLLPDHAAFLPDHSALVLSDVHLGKAAAFQAKGLAIPEGDDLRDLKRIEVLLNQTGAKHLIIAGDLIHSAAGNTPRLQKILNEWISSLTAETTLVLGNHDQKAIPGKSLPKVNCVDHLELDRIFITHDPSHAPSSETGHFSICGHLHPAIRIKDGKRTCIRSACFWQREHMLVLPSFGSFTGGQLIQPAPDDAIHISLNGRIVEIPATLRNK